MSFLRKRAQSPKSSPQQILPGGTGKFGLEVVGESNYQKALFRAKSRARRIGERLCIDVIVGREPTNKYDPDAVQVLALNGDLLGYLSRGRATEYRRVLGLCAEANIEVRCVGALVGDDILGIWLDLAFSGDLGDRLKAMPQSRAPESTTISGMKGRADRG
jgi:hypothetical protein